MANEMDPKHSKTNKLLLSILASCLLLGGIAFTLYQTQVLSHLFRKFPRIDDISQETDHLLKTTAETSLNPAGPRFEIAISQKNPQFPIFYVASNLPDHFNLILILAGKAGEILSHADVMEETTLSLVHGLGKSPSFHLKIHNMKGFQPLPEGYYEIWLTEDDTQLPHNSTFLKSLPPAPSAAQPSFIPKGKKILYSKKLFIGTMSLEEYEAQSKSLNQNTFDGMNSLVDSVSHQH